MLPSPFVACVRTVRRFSVFRTTVAYFARIPAQKANPNRAYKGERRALPGRMFSSFLDASLHFLSYLSSLYILFLRRFFAWFRFSSRTRYIRLGAHVFYVNLCATRFFFVGAGMPGVSNIQFLGKSTGCAEEMGRYFQKR